MASFSQTLRHRISVQRRAESRDDWGQPIEEWTEVAKLWADIRAASGLETIRAGAESSTVKASIRIRYRTDLTAAMRVVHGTDVYNILAVLPDQKRRVHVDLVCELVK